MRAGSTRLGPVTLDRYKSDYIVQTSKKTLCNNQIKTLQNLPKNIVQTSFVSLKQYLKELYVLKLVDHFVQK